MKSKVPASQFYLFKEKFIKIMVISVQRCLLTILTMLRFLSKQIKFISQKVKNPTGSGHANILIFYTKHCIFKRFSTLNDLFGGQNGQFNEMGAWRGDKRKRLKAVWTQMNTDEHGKRN
jgi:hypothetical protein